jgi:hypothetical protein
MTSPDPTLDLRQRLAAGEVTAFVGAGMSIGAQLPSWYDLIAELSARIGFKLPPSEWATGDALIDAAQAYVNRQGLHSLIRHLIRKYNSDNPLRWHLDRYNPAAIGPDPEAAEIWRMLDEV